MILREIWILGDAAGMTGNLFSYVSSNVSTENVKKIINKLTLSIENNIHSPLFYYAL